MGSGFGGASGSNVTGDGVIDPRTPEVCHVFRCHAIKLYSRPLHRGECLFKHQSAG